MTIKLYKDSIYICLPLAQPLPLPVPVPVPVTLTDNKGYLYSVLKKKLMNT
jgi:hypothetical protein